MITTQHSRKGNGYPALKLSRLWKLIGNTPMLELIYAYKGQKRKLYVKCEHYNLTGSIKDRMALYILQKAYEQEALHPGSRIIEATSGNTGISFSALGRALGHPVTIIMPDWLSRERTDIIKSFGAEIIPVSKEQGGFIGSIKLSEVYAAKDPSVFLPRQFENRYNAEAHERTTGPEITRQLQRKGLRTHAFVAGVGTGGTVMGVGYHLRAAFKDVQVFAIEPAESPTLTTGYKTGSHRIQGISDEFIPSIVNLSKLNGVIKVSDGDAILMAQKLSRQLGLAVGISSGANVIGAILVQDMLSPDCNVVTVIPDSNKKYLSTDLMKEERIKESYITPKLDFLDFSPIERICVCDTGLQ